MARSRAPRTRVILVVAIALLLLDAVLLVTAGLWTDRMGLVVGGAVAAIAALLVFLSWRRHLNRLAEIDAARRDLQEGVKALGELVRDRK